MPPNTKNAAVKPLPCPDVGFIKDSRYPPLTEESSITESSPSTPRLTQEPITSVDSDDYWDWNAKTDEDYWEWQHQEGKAEIDHLLSIDHIEENLVQDGQQKMDDYWDMSEGKQMVHRPSSAEDGDKRDLESYWQWNLHPDHQILSSAAIEANLLRHVDKPTVKDLNSRNDDYWDTMTAKDREAANGPTEIDLYWAERTTPEQHKIDTSSYWEWESFPSTTISFKSNGYWDW